MMKNGTGVAVKILSSNRNTVSRGLRESRLRHGSGLTPPSVRPEVVMPSSLPVVVLQDGTVGTVMVVVLIQILDYSALNMVSYFAARKGIFLMYTTRITSVIRFRSGHKEARTMAGFKNSWVVRSSTTDNP